MRFSCPNFSLIWTLLSRITEFLCICKCVRVTSVAEYFLLHVHVYVIIRNFKTSSWATLCRKSVGNFEVVCQRVSMLLLGILLLVLKLLQYIFVFLYFSFPSVHRCRCSLVKCRPCYNIKNFCDKAVGFEGV